MAKVGTYRGFARLSNVGVGLFVLLLSGVANAERPKVPEPSDSVFLVDNNLLSSHASMGGVVSDFGSRLSADSLLWLLMLAVVASVAMAIALHKCGARAVALGREFERERRERLRVEEELQTRQRISRRLKATAERLKESDPGANTSSADLEGMLMICAWCSKIREEDGSWKRIETYIAEHTNATFTHGICPCCQEKLMKEDDSTGVRELETDV